MPVGIVPASASDAGFTLGPEFGTSVNAPFAPIVNAVTSLETRFVTYRNSLLGDTVTALGAVPIVEGREPGTGVRLPVVVLIKKPDMLFSPP
jgi:hypothetical protein